MPQKHAVGLQAALLLRVPSADTTNEVHVAACTRDVKHVLSY